MCTVFIWNEIITTKLLFVSDDFKLTLTAWKSTELIPLVIINKCLFAQFVSNKCYHNWLLHS